MNVLEIVLRYNSVTILKNVFANEVLLNLYKFFDAISADTGDNDCIGYIKLYSKFVESVNENGGDLGLYLKQILFEDENIYVKIKCRNEDVNANISAAINFELDFLKQLSELNCTDVKQLLKKHIDKYEHSINIDDILDNLPCFDNTIIDYPEEYKTKIQRLAKDGYGIYSKYSMFKLSNTGEIIPVKSADTQTVDDLIGYENERGKVIANTRALLNGKPAANLLLYGAAGTGKSSTVKAVTNLLRVEGIRLIEVKKEQLMMLPLVMEQINENPLKFIIFIDDLTFNNEETGFGTLKAILEGSASAKSNNAVIYATSNRRHMVKESFSDREGDDIHREDTIQEQTSLSERFGMTILFDKPNKFQYINIVNALADAAGLEMDNDKLAVKAEAFALRKGGRSARCAKQFVDSIMAEL